MGRRKNMFMSTRLVLQLGQLVAGSLPVGPSWAQLSCLQPTSDRYLAGFFVSMDQTVLQRPSWSSCERFLIVGKWWVMTGEWYQDTLGRRSMIEFVVVSSDLFKSYFRENFSQILREAGDIDSGWTMFFASIFNAASSEPGGGSKECH